MKLLYVFVFCYISGGDRPEAVADALHDVLKLSWRDDATKICVFITDAPPHGLVQRDGFPDGKVLIIIANAWEGVSLKLLLSPHFNTDGH